MLGEQLQHRIGIGAGLDDQCLHAVAEGGLEGAAELEVAIDLVEQPAAQPRRTAFEQEARAGVEALVVRLHRLQHFETARRGRDALAQAGFEPRERGGVFVGLTETFGTIDQPGRRTGQLS